LLIELQLQDETTELIALSRLQDYAHKALRLKHQSLLSVYEVGTQKSLRWVLVRHAGPISWLYLNELSGRLNVSQACSVLSDIANALDYLYRMQLRGGKVLNWNDFVRLSYGAGRPLALSIVPPSPTDLDLSLQGKYCATSGYTAPELFDSFSPTPSSDSFALSAIGFHLFSGKPLIQTENSRELARVMRELDFPRIRKILPAFPGDLAEFLEVALRSSPERRPTLQSWINTLAKDEAHSLPQGAADEATIKFQKPQYAFQFTNVLHGVPVHFKNLAQTGEAPMNVLMISEVDDGKYTLNLPSSNRALPDYCHLCGGIGQPPVRFCSLCGHALE
jgi:serine/threonine protein kinase